VTPGGLYAFEKYGIAGGLNPKAKINKQQLFKVARGSGKSHASTPLQRGRSSLHCMPSFLSGLWAWAGGYLTDRDTGF